MNRTSVIALKIVALAAYLGAFALGDQYAWHHDLFGNALNGIGSIWRPIVIVLWAAVLVISAIQVIRHRTDPSHTSWLVLFAFILTITAVLVTLAFTAFSGGIFSGIIWSAYLWLAVMLVLAALVVVIMFVNVPPKVGRTSSAWSATTTHGSSASATTTP